MAGLSVIRELIIKATTQGVDQAAASVNKLADSQEKLGQSSAKVEKATLSTDAALQRLSRRYDQELRAQQDLARASEVLQRARDQGLISQQRQNELMQLAVRHHNSAGDAAQKQTSAIGNLARSMGGLVNVGKASNVAMAELSNTGLQMAGSLGAAGRVLSALGPVGATLAIVLGTLSVGFGLAAHEALKFADSMGKLVDTADTVGLTVEQLRALQLAAAQVGINGDALNSLLEKFSVSLEKVREGSEKEVNALERLQTGLSGSVQQAKTMDEALNLVLGAMGAAEASAARLSAREIFGKQGLAAIRLAGVDLNNLVENMNSVDLASTKLARSIDAVGDAINENFKLAGTNITSTFALPVLDAFEQISKVVLELSRTFALLAGGPISSFFEPMIDGLKQVSNLLNAFNIDLANLGLSQALSNLKDNMTAAFGPQVTAAIQLVAALLASLGELVAAEIALFKSLGSAIIAAFRFDSSGISAAFSAAGDAIIRMRDAAKGAGSAVIDLTPKIVGAGEATETTTKNVENGSIGWVNYVSGVNDATTQASRWLDGQRKVPPVMGAATQSVKDNTKAVKDNTDQIGQAAGQAINTFITGILDGKSAVEALSASLQGLGRQLIQIGTQDIGKQLASSLGSLLPTLGGFGLGGVATAGIGIGISLIGKLFGGNNKEAEEAARRQAEELQKARDAWAAMTQQLEDFNRAAAGLVKGELRTNLQELEAQRQPLAAAAIKAQNFAALAEIQATFFAGQARLLQEFADSLPALHAMLTSEGGLAGATSQTIAAVKTFRDQVMGLKDSLEQASQVTGDAVFIGPQWSQFANEAQGAALALLDQAKQQSDLIAEYNRTKTAAEHLQQVLVELGMSAEDAAAAIDQRLTAAIDKLRGQFIDNLVREINKLVGADWINQVTDLVQQVAQLRADAAALGIDTVLIDNFYALAAANIIKENKLVGDSLNAVALMTGFTADHLADLAKSLEDVGAAVTRTIDEINSAIQSNEDRLALALHRSDSLADQLFRFDLAAQREREAEIKAGGQALASLEAALMQERLNIINDFNEEQARLAKEAADRAAEEAERVRQEQIAAAQRAAEERARILKEAEDFIHAQTRRIQEWIAQFLAGPTSFLPPSQQLAQAQQHFASELAAAASGSRDALSDITTSAQSVVDATRRYYGSGAQGQAIIQNLLNQLQGLPAQLSPEEFIVEGVTEAVDNLGTTVTTTTTTQTTALTALLNNLKLAIESNDAQAIAVALLPLFDTLDTTMDQALTFAEFQAGLGGIYSTGTLRGIFDNLDGNGNGILEKAELIKIATQGTEVATGTTNTRMATNNDLLNQLVALNGTGGAEYNVLINILQTLGSIYSVEANYLPLLLQIAQWAPGSSHAEGGLLVGPTHADGGVQIAPGHYAEGGEYIMSRATVSRYGTGTMDAMNFGAANDNIFSAIRGLERSLLRGIKALMDTHLEAAAITARPLQEANKLSRTRRGENKKIA